MWRDIKEEYGDLLPSIDTADAELEMWQHYYRVSERRSTVPAAHSH